METETNTCPVAHYNCEQAFYHRLNGDPGFLYMLKRNMRKSLKQRQESARSWHAGYSATL